MNHIEFNNKAVQLIQSLQASLQQLDACGDVGRSVEDEVELINTFMAENKIPQKPTDLAAKMLQEPDQYACIAISTAALTDFDKKKLSKEYANVWTTGGMFMQRDNGWLVKLYEEYEMVEQMFEHAGKIDPDYYNIKKICLLAHEAGYRMVEFDSAATLFSEGFTL